MQAKHKNIMIKAAIVFAWFLGCYLIGQTINAPEQRIETSQQEKQLEMESQPCAYTVVIQNAKEVSKEEIPWGITAGEITMEDDTNVWLLTPGTGAIVEAEKSIILQYTIHPWMHNISDGAVITVKENGKEFMLPVDAEWHEYTTEEESQRIEVSVSEENDLSGDWVIFVLKNKE